MPESRIEQYLEYLAFGTGNLPEKPESRVEEYLLYLCQKGGSSGSGELYLHSYRCRLASSDNLTQLMVMISLILPTETKLNATQLKNVMTKIGPYNATGSVAKRSNTSSPYTIESAICGISFGESCYVWYNGASSFITVPISTLSIYNGNVNAINNLLS